MREVRRKGVLRGVSRRAFARWLWPLALAGQLACGEGTVGEGEASSFGARGGKKCGNGVCNTNESCSSCPADCGPCDSGSTSGAGASSGGSPASGASSSATSSASGTGGSPSSGSSGAGGAGAVGALIFESGWENAPGPGCDAPPGEYEPHLTDSFAWDDHSSNPCNASCGSWSGPAAIVVSDEKFSGQYALRSTFPDDGGCGPNGLDFRLSDGFDTPRANVVIRWRAKWSDGFRWAPHDHKVVIAGPSDAQAVYFNLRGHADGTGYPAIHVIPSSEELFVDSGFSVTYGEWHLFEVHIVTGSSGRIEAWIDGQALDLRSANDVAPVDIEVGAALDYFKLDTTYNDFAWFVQSVSGDAYVWYDDVQVFEGL